MSRQMTYSKDRINSRTRPPSLASGLLRSTRLHATVSLRLGLTQFVHFFIFLRFRCLRRIRFLAHLSLIRDDNLIINNKPRLFLTNKLLILNSFLLNLNISSRTYSHFPSSSHVIVLDLNGAKIEQTIFWVAVTSIWIVCILNSSLLMKPSKWICF